MGPIAPSQVPTDVQLIAGSDAPTGRWSLDDVADQLSQLRDQAGSPSYSTLARRVRQLRTGRGVPPGEGEPGRITVYDCFRQGRRRMQPDLVSDIVLALGGSTEQATTWARACTVAQMEGDAAAVVTVRSDLPSSPGPFVGRGEQIDQLVDVIKETPGALVVLHGMPGSGKSRLAFRTAHTLVGAAVVRRALVAELRGHHAKRPPAAPAAVLDGLLRALGTPGREVPAGIAERRRLLSERLAEQQAVLVLDDAHDLKQVKALLPESLTPVIVTSRRLLPELGAQLALPVGTLDQTEAVELLATIADLPLTDPEREVATTLVQTAGLLPLSVGLVAARVAARPDWSLTDHLQALQSRREALRLDDDVEVALHLSYRTLGEHLRHGLRMLAIHPCDELDTLACAALLGRSPGEAARTLEELAAHHLVLERTPQRYSLHDLTRAFALARSYDEDRPADREEALSRLHEHLVGSVRAAAEQLGLGAEPRFEAPATSRSFDEEAAAEWVTQEFGTLLAISAHGLAHDRPQTAVQISEDLAFWLIRSADRTDLADLHEHARSAAERLGDTEGMARAALAIGQVQVRESRFEEAVPALLRATAAFAAIGDAMGASRATTALGMIDVHQGRLDTAIERFTDVLRTMEGVDDPARHGIALDNLSVAYIRAGRLEEALDCQQQSLALAQESGDIYTRANVLGNMASVHQQRGAADEALRAAQESLELGEQLNSVPIMAYAMSIKGRALLDLGDLEEAERTLHTAEGLATRLHDEVLRGAVVAHLALLAQHRGQDEQARSGFEQARDIAAAVGATFEQASASDALAELALAAGDAGSARAHWQAALSVFESMGSPEAARVRSRLQAEGLG